MLRKNLLPKNLIVHYAFLNKIFILAPVKPINLEEYLNTSLVKENNVLVLFCVSLWFMLSSCSKSNDASPTPVTPPVTPPVPPIYSTTVLKGYELDTTKQAPNDTISRWFFFYDNANRLINDSLSMLAGTSIYTRIRSIQYNGSDTNAFRSITKGYTGSAQNVEIDTAYYTFSNGNYVADTVVYHYLNGGTSETATSKTTFSYQSGIISRSFQNWIPQLSYTGSENETIYKTVVNGDIVQQTDTLYSFSNGQPSGSQMFQTTVSYLPNPNPLFKLYRATAKEYFTAPGIGNFINSQYAPSHLISQQISTAGNITYDYSFRQDGYPLTARVSGDGNGGQTTKLIFVYAQN